MNTALHDESEMEHGDHDSPHVVIALDIGGVLSRHIDNLDLRQLDADAELPFGAAWVEDDRGTTRLLRTAPAVVVELDEIVQQPGVQLLWVTAAPRFVHRAIELAFGGRLANGVAAVDVYRESNWKMCCLLAYTASLGDPALVWIDDSAIEFALRVSPEFREGDIGPSQRLLISPDPSVGLTLDDVGAIRDFVQVVLGGKR